MQATIHNRNLEWRSPQNLKSFSFNAHKHSPKQVRQIADSICEFSWGPPILIDEDGYIIAGEGRKQAALLLKLETVPVLVMPGLTEEQKRALMIADNKITENADWDIAILADNFEVILDSEVSFDIPITGFDLPEIDLIIQEANDEAAEAEPDTVSIEKGPPVAEEGDLFILGRHRLYCGDALKADSYAALLDEEKASAVVSDLPYNVPVPGHVSGKGRIKHENFSKASGELSSEGFEAFLGTAFDHTIRHSIDGSLHYYFMDWRHTEEIEAAARNRFTEKKNLAVWVKDNGGMGSLYRSRHELIYVYKSGTAPHINNIKLGRYGRNRTNVWEYPGANSFSKNRAADLSAHPTVKPTPLIADILLDSTHRGDLVLDPFAGSGTIILAAEKAGRRAAAIEIEPKFVDVAIRRFEDLTGVSAILDATGDTFAEVAAKRANESSTDDMEAAHAR